jgi:formamidopyrimidine-DNA glycosylase
MPELPEIESLSRQLAEYVVGDEITNVTARQPRSLNLPADEFIRRAAGPIRSVGRVGKSVTMDVPEGSVWLHLGVNGQILLNDAGGAPPDAVVRLDLASGRSLAMQRIFMGHAHFHSPEESDRVTAKFGADPLSDRWSIAYIQEIFARKKKVAVKAILMDQNLVAGIGNAYSDEVLFAAGLNPLRRADDLTAEEIARLHASTRAVLEKSVSLGGDNDYTDLFGVQGRFSTSIHSQERCTTCGRAVETIKTGGRTTYLCPVCQPMP